MSEQAAIGRVNAQQAASSKTLASLIIFSLSLGIVPITAYFVSSKFIWEGNGTFSAITAVVAANLVLLAYIITSLLEDRETTRAPAPTKISEEAKKDR